MTAGTDAHVAEQLRELRELRADVAALSVEVARLAAMHPPMTPERQAEGEAFIRRWQAALSRPYEGEGSRS